MPHVPKCQTGDLEILSFDAALAQYQAATGDPYDHEKWLLVPDLYTEYRYILGSRGRHPLIAIGINPSTAMPDDLDNTLKSVDRIAHGNGFDSFIMFNVYAQRATDPQKMETQFNAALHAENMKAFDYLLSLSEAPAVWAAWGTNVKRRPYLKTCVADMIKIGIRHRAQWFCCGARSRVGDHPHHPLYLPKTAPLEVFDPVEYLNADW